LASFGYRIPHPSNCWLDRAVATVPLTNYHTWRIRTTLFVILRNGRRKYPLDPELAAWEVVATDGLSHHHRSWLDLALAVGTLTHAEP
jgi:hypothetical protein